MLFNYRLFEHDVKKLQIFFEHTVLEVWCNADINSEFSIGLLHPDYNMLYSTRNKLHKDIEEIYNDFKTFSEEQKEKIKEIFINNNKIEELCKGQEEAVFYKEIKEDISEEFADKLKEFNNYLYIFLDKDDASFVRNFDSLTKYYKKLVSQLPGKVCPFCGINTINSKRLSKRDAFDHYLPKSLIPFTAINVKNLAPMCKDCNEDWKHSINPIKTNKDEGDNRKTFYPFNSNLYNLEVSISRLELDPSFDEDGHIINIEYKCDDNEEEVNSWLELFNIQERYDDLIRTNLNYWLEDWNMIKDENNYKNPREKELAKERYIRNRLDNRFINSNFIYLAIIDARENL